LVAFLVFDENVFREPIAKPAFAGFLFLICQEEENQAMEANAIEILGADLDEFYASERSRILVVEDDQDTAFLLKQILRHAGYDVLSAANGKEALNKVNLSFPDLVLLDLMMPEMDGWETIDRLRQVTTTPVIVLTAMANKENVVTCLQRGVDDYMTKPFYKAEVIARVNAVLRRSRTARETSRYVFPQVGLAIDTQTREVRLKNTKIQLTGKEFGVLLALAKHAPEIVHYQKIAQTVWGKDFPQARQRIKYLIYLLRQKFQEVDVESGDLIINIDRLGYKLITGEG
jgi:DNA-binding response OmpR family regulator